MQDPLPHGGSIRKLWIAEAERYRDHLLRLDLESRRSRFAGTVSDAFLTDYAGLGYCRMTSVRVTLVGAAPETSQLSRQPGLDRQH